MISFKSASEIQKYARERERELYSKRMIKLVRCGYVHVNFLQRTRKLSVVFIRFSCFSVTTFCLFVLSFISHLSSAHLSLFLLASKSATEACFFTFFTFCGRCMVVFVVKKRKEKKIKQKPAISHSRRRHSCDALSRVREPVYSHTHTHCIYLCNLQNPKSTLGQNARTSKKSLFVFLVCYKSCNPPISTRRTKTWRRRKRRCRTRRISPSVPSVVSSKPAYRVRFHSRFDWWMIVYCD